MFPHCSHISRKRGVYYYRRRLPVPYKGELTLSMRTRSYREAEHLVYILNLEFDQFFDQRPRMADLKAILRERLQAARDADLQQHLRTPAGRPVYGMHTGQYDPLDVDHEIISGLLSDARERLARREVRYVTDEVEQLMTAHGLSEETRVELGIGLLQINVKSLESALQRVREGVRVDELESTGIDLCTSDGPKKNVVGSLLSEAWPLFVELMVAEEGWRGQTENQNSATYRIFIQCCGDKPVGAYSRQDCAKFFDMLRGLPALYSKKKEWRGLSVPAIVDATATMNVERLSMKTINRHFSALGRLFDHFKRRGDFDGENPAHGFQFPTKGRANKKRQMWEGDILRELFSSPVWSGCYSASRRASPGRCIIKDARFWLPILGLYHGNRLEEFAQLELSDLIVHDGIHCFDINDEGQKQLKNEQSKRRVPVHPKLIDLGFLDYVEQARCDSRISMFPELEPAGPDNKKGYYFTKWWTRYRQSIGIYEKGLDYHSFRHGVTTKLYAAGVEEVLVDELTGHDGGGTSRRIYKKEMPLGVLLEAISKVSWPELDGLLAGKTAR